MGGAREDYAWSYDHPSLMASVVAIRDFLQVPRNLWRWHMQYAKQRCVGALAVGVCFLDVAATKAVCNTAAQRMAGNTQK